MDPGGHQGRYAQKLLNPGCFIPDILHQLVKKCRESEVYISSSLNLSRFGPPRDSIEQISGAYSISLSN